MILAAGEALFDMIGTPVGAGQAFLPVYGGSPLNVALGLSRLGRSVAYLTKLSTDYFGEALHDFMVREGIDTRFVVRAPGAQTTLAFVAFDGAGHPAYSFYAAGAADRSMTEADLPAALDPAIKAVHFGSISLALEPTATTLFSFLKQVSASRVVALDPNVRASIIADRTLWLERFATMRAHADIVKASAEDVAWIEGDDADAEEVARRWSTEGPAVAFVTDGGRGVAVAVDGESVFVPSFAVEVTDTVGAGDTFQAAVLTRLDEMGLLSKERIRKVTLETMSHIARFGTAAAAITCTRLGADLPRRDEVAAFLDEHHEGGSS